MLQEIMQSEAVLSIAASVIGLVWAGVKGSGLLAQRRRRRFDRALLALEAGVEKSWQTYVRELKRGREDGKLSQDEARHARQLAVETALQVGRQEGIDVLAELGRDYVDAFIARLLRNRKLDQR